MPAASEVEIVNLAITLHLGGTPLPDFDSVDDPTGPATASVMRLAYPKARDSLLVAAPWNFAVRRVAPALLAAAPLYGFAKAYQLPEGGGPANPLYCLRVMDTNLDPSWGVWGPWPWGPGPWPWPVSGVQGLWQIEGRTLVADAADVKIRYLAQVLDPSSYPPAFVDALAVELAARAAFTLTRDNNTATRLRKEADMARDTAIAADAREGSLMRVIDTTLTECR